MDSTSTSMASSSMDESSSSSPQSTTPSSSPVATLVTDLFHIITSFLDHDDWLSSMRVCKYWTHCNDLAPSRHMSFRVGWSQRRLPSLPPIRLRYHYTTISDVACHMIRQTNLLVYLCQQLPHLTNISTEIESPFHGNSVAVPWPNSLKQVRINLHEWVNPVLISSVFTAASLTHLTLEGLSSGEDFSILQPLEQLSHLKSLHLSCEHYDESFDLILAMQLASFPTHLQSLNICDGNADLVDLTTLSRMQPLMELCEFILDDRELGENELDLIHQIAPNLTSLAFSRLNDHRSNLNILKQFHALHTIRIHYDADGDEVSEEEIYDTTKEIHGCTPDEMERLVIDGLCSCKHITEIKFSGSVPYMKRVSWTQLAQSLTNLKRLSFELEVPYPLEILLEFHQITSLRFEPRRLAYCNDDDSSDRKMIRDFFQSSSVLPNLRHLEIPPWSWTTGVNEQDNYRCIPPAARMVGIELNPGPSSIIGTSPGPPITTRSQSLTAQTFFVDGILSIFQFLTLRDLLPALHSCHYWYDCGLKEKCRQLEFKMPSFLKDDDDSPTRRFMNLLSSPLNFHVTRLLQLHVSQILLTQQLPLPNLVFLTCVFDEKLNSPRMTSLPSLLLNDTFILPKSLRSLEIDYSRICTAFASCQSFIDAIPTGSEISSLAITSFIWGGLNHHYNLSSLIRCSKLKHLKVFLTPSNDEELVAAQKVCANLPLETLHVIQSWWMNWTIFHPESPLMLNIRHLDMDCWTPKPDDWSHLLSHPPPHLRSMSVCMGVPSGPIPDLAALKLTSLKLKHHASRSNYNRPPPPDHSGWIPMIISCHASLTSLYLINPNFTDVVVGQILRELKHLDEFTLTCWVGQMSPICAYLPRKTTLVDIESETFESFCEELVQSKRLELFQMDEVRLSSKDEVTVIDYQSRLIDLCINRATWLNSVAIERIHGVNLDFKYSKAINSHPPASRLVGVESNPGPSDSDNTHTQRTMVSSQSLFNDAMHIIYSYIDSTDFVSTIQTCHHWYDCGAPSLQTGHRPQVTNDALGLPPAPRLVGIELNPGPFDLLGWLIGGDRLISTNTTSASNFQLNRVKSTFMSAMVQPCLVNLCTYFTLTERIRNQSISRAWLSMIRLPRWWRDLQFDYDLFKLSDSRPCLPWLCSLLGGIRLQLRRNVIPLAQLLRPWTHIHHLELSDVWTKEEIQLARPSLEEARAGLIQLRLTSFVWQVSRWAMFTSQVLFATPAEMNVPPHTDGVPPAGALFAWNKTLERFTAEYEGDGHGIINLMLGMALVLWPELKDIQLSQKKSNVAKRLSAPHMRGVKQFLTCQTIPQLRRFQLILTVNGDSLQELTDIVEEAFLSTPFTQSLTELDLCIGTPITHPFDPENPYDHFYDPDKKSMNYSLVGTPPIQYCFNTLTRISFTGFNSAWLKAISHCSELVNLSIETPILSDVNEYEFFDIISRLPIATLTMSYFTSSSDGFATAVDESLARGLRHSLLEMTRLTSLAITLRPDQQRSVGYRVHHNHWLAYLDCFVRLSRLECTIQLLQPAGSDMDWMYDESTYKIRIETAKYPTQMLTAITNLLNLESLTLSAVGETDLKILNEGWMERLKGKDLNGQERNPSPILLSQLTLDEINVTPGVRFRWLHQLATYLPQFPRLFDLSISLYNHLNDSQSNPSDLNKFYELLSHCSHLRYLNLLGCGRLRPDVIRYWCNSSAQDGGPKFRFLERLEFYHYHNHDNYDGALPLFYSLPNLSEINGGYFHHTVDDHFIRTNAELNRLPYPHRPAIHFLTPMNSRPKTQLDRIVPIEGVRMDRLINHRFS